MRRSGAGALGQSGRSLAEARIEISNARKRSCRYALSFNLYRRDAQAKTRQSFDVMGRFILITLFLIGLWQLAKRLHASSSARIDRSRSPSLMNNEEKPKPFTCALAFLVIAYVVCVVAGLRRLVQYYIVSDMAYFFGQQVRPDLLFYPLIAVLIVNTMHSVASKLDT
ncbi:MAG: hypothetical protein WKH64_19240 [Chloroflexia bacterium]